MEAIKKQASKLREQVARQQQVILRQLGQLGREGVMIDESDMHRNQQLQDLYKSTRAAKHFQRDIVRGLEGFISTSKRQMVIARRLAEDCCKYGIENQDSTHPLARIASNFGTSHASMEDQRETMLGILGYQVSEPLRALINGAPLEDARHLTHRHDRMCQEFEIQAAEVIRRQSKFRDTSAESVLKLKSAENKLTELKSSMLALGREATAAMLSVEDQQQETTFQKFLSLVDAERSYHRNVVTILEKLHSEMILEGQMEDYPPEPEIPTKDDDIPSVNDNTVSIRSSGQNKTKDDHIPSANDNTVSIRSSGQNKTKDDDIPCVNDNTVSISSNGQNKEDGGDSYFIAKVIHSFDAQAEGELNLEVDDYVVVRQVAANGWSEGESKGRAGWFPSAYVEKKDSAPATKLSEDKLTP